MTGRKFWTFSLVLVLCVIVTAGCSKRRSSRTTINQGSDIFTTDSFPGASVQDGNVADDKRAFSPSGEDYQAGSLQVTVNGDRGTAMVTYRTDGGLYAQHYNGTWTPPVALRAIDAAGVPSVSIGDLVVHAFLNTDGDDSSFAAERDGDCIIVWRSDDIDDDGVSTGDGVNTCLFATYFDATYREDISRRYGFREFAQRLNSNDEVDEDVTTFGVVTDGLCGEARFTSNTGTAAGGFGTGTSFGSYSYGNPTTSIEVFWRQTENNDGDVAIEDVNFYSIRFNLEDGSIAADVPLTATSEARLGIAASGASNSSTDSQETLVDVNAVVYNNLLLYVVGADDAAVGAFGVAGDWDAVLDADDDYTIQYHYYNLASGSISTATSLTGTADSADTDENGAAFLSEDTYNTVWGDMFSLSRNSMYGSDQGLACAVIYFAALIEEPTGTFTVATNSADYFIAEISEATGALLEVATVTVDDPDINDVIDMDWVDTRISRNGDYIWIAWMAVTDQTADELDVYAACYITTRPDEDGTFSIPPLATSLSVPWNLSPDTDDGCSWFQFQDGLGYICGKQSDPDVMYLYFQESDGNPDVVRETVLDSGIASGLVPFATTSTFFSFDNDGDQPGGVFVNNERIAFNSVDGGFDGEIYVAFVDDYDGTTTVDRRLTGYHSGLGGGSVELSSGTSTKEVAVNSEVRLIATPNGTDIGVYNTVDAEESEDRAHGAGVIHTIFRESESHQNSGLGLALRTRSLDLDLGSTTFGSNFVPDAAAGTFELPFDIDLPLIDPPATRQATIVGVAVEGDTVGVWFTEMFHLYYQEVSGAGDGNDVAWANENGASDPALIDDDNDEELIAFTKFATDACVCDTLTGAMVFWTKQYGSGASGSLSNRLQVRVRD